MAENFDAKAAVANAKGAALKANANMAKARGSAKANMAQQKAKVMLGEIKKATVKKIITNNIYT